MLMTANRVFAADTRTVAGAVFYPAFAAVTGNIFAQTAPVFAPPTAPALDDAVPAGRPRRGNGKRRRHHVADHADTDQPGTEPGLELPQRGGVVGRIVLLQRAQQVAVEGAHDGAPKAVTRGPRAGHIGNQAQLRRLEAKTAPADLRVGPVDDPLEREADAVAGRVMRMSEPGVALARAPLQVSRKCEECEEEEKKKKIQRKATGPQATPGEAPAIVHDVLRAPGQPLDHTTRDYFEPRFGQDFTHVRVHTGASAEQSARAVNANAYTVGRDIVFDAGRFAPDTDEGRLLIAHELTHVVQQSRWPPPSPPRETALERDADRAARNLAHDLPIRVMQASPVTLSRSGPGSGSSRAPQPPPPRRANAVYDETMLANGNVRIRARGTLGDPVPDSGLRDKYPLPNEVGLPGYDRWHLSSAEATGFEAGIVYTPKNFNVSRTALVENKARDARDAVREQGGNVYFDFSAECRVVGEYEGVRILALESASWQLAARTSKTKIILFLNESATPPQVLPPNYTFPSPRPSRTTRVRQSTRPATPSPTAPTTAPPSSATQPEPESPPAPTATPTPPAAQSEPGPAPAASGPTPTSTPTSGQTKSTPPSGETQTVVGEHVIPPPQPPPQPKPAAKPPPVPGTDSELAQGGVDVPAGATETGTGEGGRATEPAGGSKAELSTIGQANVGEQVPAPTMCTSAGRKPSGEGGTPAPNRASHVKLDPNREPPVAPTAKSAEDIGIKPGSKLDTEVGRANRAEQAKRAADYSIDHLSMEGGKQPGGKVVEPPKADATARPRAADYAQLYSRWGEGPDARRELMKNIINAQLAREGIPPADIKFGAKSRGSAEFSPGDWKMALSAASMDEAHISIEHFSILVENAVHETQHAVTNFRGLRMALAVERFNPATVVPDLIVDAARAANARQHPNEEANPRTRREALEYYPGVDGPTSRDGRGRARGRRRPQRRDGPPRQVHDRSCRGQDGSFEEAGRARRTPRTRSSSASCALPRRTSTTLRRRSSRRTTRTWLCPRRRCRGAPAPTSRSRWPSGSLWRWTTRTPWSAPTSTPQSRAGWPRPATPMAPGPRWHARTTSSSSPTPFRKRSMG